MTSVFALIGLQLYQGVLRRICVFLPPNNVSDIEYYEFIHNIGKGKILFKINWFLSKLFLFSLENWIVKSHYVTYNYMNKSSANVSSYPETILCGNSSFAR